MNEYEHILKSEKCDTFYSLNNDGEILFEHEFKKTGTTFLEGVLEDEVVFRE